MTKKDALAKILTAMEEAMMAADTAKRMARRRQYHAVADAFRNCAALVQKIEVEPFEKIEELRQSLTDIANLCWDAKRHINNLYSLQALADVDEISQLCATALQQAQTQKAPDERGPEE